MSLQHLFLVLQITTNLPALCFKIKNLETRTSQLFLGKDGKLLDTSRTPNCGAANKIILKSYTYNQMLCTSASCNSVHEEKLSDSTALQLHQNCSFRQACGTLHFPVPRNLLDGSSRILAVTIHYQCIDDEHSILNVCEKHKMNFTDTLHLTFKYYTRNLKECICWVNNGAFSLKIIDLRLKSRNEDVCSAAKFVINGHHYTCDPESDSYGAIFGELIHDDMPLGAFISLVPKSDNTLPEMVWIQLTPEESSQIDCHGDRIASKDSDNIFTESRQGLSTISVASVTTETSHPSVIITGKENGSTTYSLSPGDNNTGYWVAICALFILLAVVLGVLGIVWRNHVRLKRYIRRQGHLQNEKASNDQDKMVHDNTRLPTISKMKSISAVRAEQQSGQSEKGLTRSELDLIEGSHSDVQRYENSIPCRSLLDIKSQCHSPDDQKSLSYLDQIDETQRKQIDIEIWKMKGQEKSQYVAKRLPQGFQTSLILEGPVTTVNTPSTSQLDLTPSTFGHSTPSVNGINDDINALNLAKSIKADDEGDFEVQGNERSHLLKDTNAVVSVTERKIAFRK